MRIVVLNIIGTYGSGRFCSCKCARCFSSKLKRKEINAKVSKKLTKEKIQKFCKKCNKLISYKNSSGYCVQCAHNLPEYKEKQRQKQLQLVANGTHSGWKTRNIKSYAEIFFEKVLNNNHILYEREKKVGKYFLDFVIGKLDLEIDGKQHKYQDRKESDMLRDEYLRKQRLFCISYRME